MRKPLPVLSAAERRRSFAEVKLRVSHQYAVAEAARCLFCEDAPCVKKCPIGVEVTRFLRHIKDRNFRSAAKVILEKNILPGVCARVCPQERLCEGACTSKGLSEPIAIGALQRFVSDIAASTVSLVPSSRGRGMKVAVVGSGPSGIACAAELSRLGYSVTIFEMSHKIGGMLANAIPAYRLPQAIVKAETDRILTWGIEVELRRRISKVSSLKEAGFDAVFVATGMSSSRKLQIEGENAPGVAQWNDFLASPPRFEESDRIAVIGGGNSAIDCARTALRSGSDNVTVLYRRSEQEMPCFPSELAEAKEEGVRLVTLCSPVAVLGGGAGKPSGVRCLQVELGEPGPDGRRIPVPKAGTDHVIETDFVIVAAGQEVDPEFACVNYELGFTKDGRIPVCEKTMMTAEKGVLAGGDAARGPSTVVEAMADGRKAALSIHDFLTKDK